MEVAVACTSLCVRLCVPDKRGLGLTRAAWRAETTALEMEVAVAYIRLCVCVSVFSRHHSSLLRRRSKRKQALMRAESERLLLAARA